METLDSCKNGVMLIDEAYSLGSEEKGDSYAKEAIDAINQSKNTDLWRFILGLGIKNIGQNASKILTKKFQSIKELINFNQ